MRLMLSQKRIGSLCERLRRIAGPVFGEWLTLGDPCRRDCVARTTYDATTRSICALGLGIIVAASSVLTVLNPMVMAQESDRVLTVKAENRRCLECHGQPHIAELNPRQRSFQVISDRLPDESSPAVRPGLYLSAESGMAAHESIRCVDCHTDSGSLPHAATLAKATCNGCHVAAEEAFLRSAHAQAQATERPDAPRCSSCHGEHDIDASSERDSSTHVLNVVEICEGCHERHIFPTTNGHDSKSYVQSYLDSVHGRALIKGGLVFAATCVECHGHHEVLPASDPLSLVHRENVPTTCGGCHLGVVETYSKSIHGKLLSEGDSRAPVCTDCHAAHTITRAATPSFMSGVANECGDCHDRPEMLSGRQTSFYQTYRASYHGQVTQLGSTAAARCSSCHGAHDILPMDDSNSRLYGENLIQTCRTCHESANARFVQFDPHADYRDAERYPLLHAVWLYFIIMMSCAFGFFGLHSIAWFIRSLIERSRNGPPPRHTNNVGIRRFTKTNRVNHAVVIITFFGLTLTGVPLFFADKGWAQRLAEVLGGASAAGLWHRGFAIMLIGNFVVHFYSIFKAARRRKKPFRIWLFGPKSMVPRIRDLKDCAVMIRWFVRGGKKPSFDRWTYWEKFDYWAELGGTGIIGGSGLLLWFDEFFGTFVPGWFFNVAMIIHGYEALLALGFIFTIHFFNAHLRMEKFPVDDVIFTGQLPEEEFIEERPEEYARLLEEGDYEALKMTRPPKWQRQLAVVVGVIAMAIGTTLVALIILGGLNVL